MSNPYGLILMEIKLSVKDRLLLISLLNNTSGKYLYVKGIMQLKEKLMFTDQEMVDFNIVDVNDGKMIKWNEDKEIPITVSLSDVVREGLKKQLIALDNQEQITEDMVHIYEIIVHQ